MSEPSKSDHVSLGEEEEEQEYSEPDKPEKLEEGDLIKPKLSEGGEQEELKRSLRSRHLQMIAIGGTIGTGLLIGSGAALATAGPAGALLAYIFVGSLVYSVVLSLGEMTTYIPIPGAFNAYATRFVDPSLGFAMGWIYWFSWAITYPIELTATGLIINYWNEDLSIGIFIAVFWVLITAFNFLPVSFYGEMEFWFAYIKVITLVAFALFSICVIFGAGAQGFIGFKTWTDPGAFGTYIVDRRPLGGFVAFWAALIQAGFSYQGTELVGVAAGEAADPRKTIPAAVKKTFFRIIFIYVGTVLFIGAQIPYTDPSLLSSSSTTAASSPLVIAANLAGVSGVADVINAVLLLTVLSAANSNVYSGSRILVGLANDGAAPAFFKRTSKTGVPYIAVAFTAAFGLLGFLNLGGNGSTIFLWLMNVTAVAGFITWSCISASHLGFMRALKAQGISRDDLPYKTRWQSYFAWYGLFFNVIILLTQGFTVFIDFNVESFFAAYVSLMLFVVMYIGHKLITKSKFVVPSEADLRTGCVEKDDTNWEDATPRSYWGQCWDKVG